MSDERKGLGLPPWLSGIIDSLVGARLILRSGIPHKNRLAVILFDSAFETACRTFLKYKEKMRLDEAHKHRDNLMKLMKAKVKDVEEGVWSSLDFYYNEIRCDFYHVSAGKTITDESMAEYQETVEFVVDKAFGIKSTQIADSTLESILSIDNKSNALESSALHLSLTDTRDRIEKMLIVIASINPENVKQVNDYFKREGDSTRLKQKDFSNILARNSGSKKLFFFNKGLRRWELSGLGRFKMKQLEGGQTEDAQSI
jgi:hypothetical protein